MMNILDTIEELTNRGYSEEDAEMMYYENIGRHDEAADVVEDTPFNHSEYDEWQ